MTKQVTMCVFALTIAVLVAASGATGAAQSAKPDRPMGAAAAVNPVLERIKTLAGEWEGTASGVKGETSFQVVSAGSAVMNILRSAGESDMVTMFHSDGPDVMVTHYCSVGNQPRMVARRGTDPNVIVFEFKDVTNLANPAAPHMRGLTLTIIDATHHTQTWTFRQDGKDQSDVFAFTRKAAAK